MRLSGRAWQPNAGQASSGGMVTAGPGGALRAGSPVQEPARIRAGSWSPQKVAEPGVRLCPDTPAHSLRACRTGVAPRCGTLLSRSCGILGRETARCRVQEGGDT